jgi:hypothetical protein
VLTLTRRAVQTGLLIATLASASTSDAQVAFKFTMDPDRFGTRIPMPAYFLDATQTDSLPIFGEYWSKGAVGAQTFTLQLGFHQSLTANANAIGFSGSQLSGFYAKIGTEVWDMTAGGYLPHSGWYWTNSLGQLTGIMFDVYSANDNGLFINTSPLPGWPVGFIATNHHYPGYDEPYSQQACAIGSGGMDGACFGGSVKTETINLRPGEEWTPEIPGTTAVVPEPGTLRVDEPRTWNACD